MKIMILNYDENNLDSSSIHFQIIDKKQELELDLYFSYNNLIAFKDRTDELLVCENIWDEKTGRHIEKIKLLNSNIKILKAHDFNEKAHLMMLSNHIEKFKMLLW